MKPWPNKERFSVSSVDPLYSTLQKKTIIIQHVMNLCLLSFLRILTLN